MNAVARPDVATVELWRSVVGERWFDCRSKTTVHRGLEVLGSRMCSGFGQWDPLVLGVGYPEAAGEIWGCSMFAVFTYQWGPSMLLKKGLP
ncbi:hypothetical protein CRG98_048521 [Punica granatum]|uniref:Uncharacterized protein n=1 Tax=Punica granatum TaxID=22663 RepID=A0A2I0HHD1_PUNGR|nr:hypothetical protein CRG98_048521 [Punica granatum]